MKSSKRNLPVKNVNLNGVVNPDWENLPTEEENDAAHALLSRGADRKAYDTARFAYPEELEKADYIDQLELHRIVEDLQFGHDLRL